MVQLNAENYRITGQQYLPSKTMRVCPNKKEGKYFDYFSPEEVNNDIQYTLIKIFSDKPEKNLVYYSLLQPEQSIGSSNYVKANIS